MHCIRGRRVIEVTETEIHRLVRAYDSVTIDVGTGDGRFAYRYARDHPNEFVIGIDASKERLEVSAKRVVRRQERGGIGNLLLVWARVHDLPGELEGFGNQIFVILPWGELLSGCLKPVPIIVESISSLSISGGKITMIFNTEVWKEPIPKPVRDLPEVTPEYVERVLVGAYLSYGLILSQTRYLSQDEVRSLRSSWAGRLAHGKQPRFLLVEWLRNSSSQLTELPRV